MSPGQWNAITDVVGVKVGQVTLIEGENIRTGVTAILPHEGNIFQEKVPAAVYVGNGFGKLVGTTQIQELGNLESPIILTNTLSVAAGMEGVLDSRGELEPHPGSYRQTWGAIRLGFWCKAILGACFKLQGSPLENV